jgi:hypothetical protein
VDTWKVEKSQPNLLCIGDTRKNIDSYFIVCDRKLLPIDAKSSTEALDTLFKVHYVVGTEYDKNLLGMWKFVQTYIYKIGDNSQLPTKVKQVFGQMQRIFSSFN